MGGQSPDQGEVLGGDDRFAKQLVRVPQAISGGREFGEEDHGQSFLTDPVAKLRIADTRLALLVCLLLAVLFCLLLATFFCHFVQMSEILVDLLLVVVQVLRLCAPFRQSGFASFVDFVSSLALLAVMLSLYCVFWRRLLKHYFVVVYCSESPLAPPTPQLNLRHLVVSGSRWVLGHLLTVVYNNVVCCLCRIVSLSHADLCVSRFTDCVHPYQVRVFIAASDSGQQ